MFVWLWLTHSADYTLCIQHGASINY